MRAPERRLPLRERFGGIKGLLCMRALTVWKRPFYSKKRDFSSNRLTFLSKHLGQGSKDTVVFLERRWRQPRQVTRSGLGML